MCTFQRLLSFLILILCISFSLNSSIFAQYGFSVAEPDTADADTLKIEKHNVIPSFEILLHTQSLLRKHDGAADGLWQKSIFLIVMLLS